MNATADPTTFDAFVEALDDLVPQMHQGRLSEAELVEQLKSPFATLVSDDVWLDEHYQLPQYDSDVTNHLLAKAADGSWTVVSVVFPPGFKTPVHDHTIWGLVGVTRGQEHEWRYSRVDDHSTPGYAELVEAEVAVNEPRSISGLVPPDDDIHAILNPATTPSCSIHVYGGNIDDVLRHRFDPERNTVKEWRSTYMVTC
ncbi:hypothetical protein JL108_03115 [Aeromicrobium sp. YIM 150415]|uniref:cysteine dioxygenase family protein n=1 Tax=Aeromicrobium sp. YIM 150415 TaxID=2803912 RepID=UPI001965DC91|nr:hypothetical protein [Aeromicrobium sp. YIM 150415]MBM9462424.1 hypothetical protein [Aeromicrobium sp. YIM 150415]